MQALSARKNQGSQVPPNMIFPSQLLFLSFTVLHLVALTTAQGTILLALATSADETATTTSIPFNTLFDASSIRKAVSIQVTHGDDISIAQDEIQCQCFSDKAGKQPLGETFSNVFPGTELGREPVKIGSIFCSDNKGMEKQMAGASPASLVEDVAITQTPSATMEITQTSTAATSTAARDGDFQSPPTSSSAPSVSSNEDEPTAFLRFALSTDPSDDSSTQMPVPIDSSIVAVGNKRVFSIVPINVSGIRGANSFLELVCQAFADSKAEKPIAAGFRLEEERSL
ncbi:MAG: hypothetical protein Q9224_007514, partial [Gallowayella concinna]